MQRKVFSRDSTGLVREISPHQAFIYNFMAIGLCTFTWVTLYSIAYSQSFEGASIGLAVVLMAVAAIPFYLCTSLLSSAMPRSGGDYVWQSRVLHPSVGFASTFSAWTVWQWYFASFLGSVITTIGFQPYFALLGRSNAYFANLAVLLAVDGGYNTSVFWITSAIILAGLVIAALGMRFYVRLQYVLFAGSAISALAILGLLATTSHAKFVSSLDSLAAPLVSASGNQTLINSVAASNGYYNYVSSTGPPTPPLNLFNTFLLFGIIWISFGYAFWSIYNLSEIKKAGEFKTQAWIQVGSSLLFAVFLVALWYLLEYVIGLRFLDSFYTYFYSGTSSNPAIPLSSFFTPYYPAIVAAISSSPVVWTLILVGLTFGIFQVILIVYFASTRIMLASSIDRVLPNSIGYVNPRSRSPLVALVISAIGCEAFLYLIIYHTSFTSYFSTAGLATQIAYILISLTAILFPFRMRKVYEASPISKYSLRGFPIISLLGILALAVNLYIAWIFILGPPIGVSAPTELSIYFVVGIFAACLVIYLIAWQVRKVQKIDLSLSFREIPPE